LTNQQKYGKASSSKNNQPTFLWSDNM